MPKVLPVVGLAKNEAFVEAAGSHSAEVKKGPEVSTLRTVAASVELEKLELPPEPPAMATTKSPAVTLIDATLFEPVCTKPVCLTVFDDNPVPTQTATPTSLNALTPLTTMFCAPDVVTKAL